LDRDRIAGEPIANFMFARPGRIDGDRQTAWRSITMKRRRNKRIRHVE
jgi:hypothetical protein